MKAKRMTQDAFKRTFTQGWRRMRTSQDDSLEWEGGDAKDDITSGGGRRK